MISPTLNQYKKSFESHLLAFLNEYEDNTKFFFLQKEKSKYQAYQKALTKIADQMKFFTREELNQNKLHRSIASDLKSIDLNIYNSIITELNPIQEETILSLSAAKKDRIKIDETSLEKHIRSSIVILKFITEEEMIQSNLQQINIDNVENENVLNHTSFKEHLPIRSIELNAENLFSVGLTPEIIKNNFEEWIFENKDIKVDFENNLIYVGLGKVRKDIESTMMLLRKNCEKNGMTENEITTHFENTKSKIKDNLLKTIDCFQEDQKLEFLLKTIKTMGGKLGEYKDFLIEEEINQLLDYDSFEGDNDIENQLNTASDENPYPRVFKDYYSYTVFKKLFDEFGNKKECLSNYSYVFYKMTYEGLIHFDLLHKTYITMLSDFDISIDRIKPKGDIGKIALRDSIYSKVK